MKTVLFLVMLIISFSTVAIAESCYCEYDASQYDYRIMQDDREVAYGFRTFSSCQNNMSNYPSCRATSGQENTCVCSYDAGQLAYEVTRGGNSLGGQYRTMFDCKQHISLYPGCR